MIYPYMNTLNLSVDNALTSQQIIHQLITKLNELVEYVNDLNVNFIGDANRYTDSKVSELSAKTSEDISNLDSKLQTNIKKVSNDLTSLSKEMTKLTDDAIKHSREYTDINVEELNKKIKEITANIEDALKQSMLYTDDNIKVVNREIKLLYNHLEELAKNSFASVSMLDGSIKKNTDCFYDMLHVFQRGTCFTLDQFIDLATFFIPSNSPFDSYIVPSNLDTLLTYCNEDYWKNYNVGVTLNDTGNKYSRASWTYFNTEEPLAVDNAKGSWINTLPPTWGNITSKGMYTLHSFKCEAVNDLEGTTTPLLLDNKLYLAQYGTLENFINIQPRAGVFNSYSKFKSLEDM